MVAHKILWLILFVHLHFENNILAAILQPNHVISSSEIELTISKIEKRSATDEEGIHLELNINNEWVTKRLNKLGDQDDAKLYDFVDDALVLQEPIKNKREWTIYGKEGEAAVIVRMDGEHGTRVEGSLRHNGEDYFIQPVEGSSSHLIHKLNYAGHIAPMGDIPDHINERIKRDVTKKKYEVELHIVFDYPYYKRFADVTRAGDSTTELIKEYYGLLINEINYRYTSFKRFGIDISVIMGGLTIYKNSRKAPYNRRLVSGGKANPYGIVLSFKGWVNRYRPDVDDVQLHSGLDFIKDIKGLAFYDGVCTTQSCGVIEDDMNFITTAVSAHELAHNLNVRHDDKNISIDCHDGVFNMHPRYKPHINLLPNYGNMWKFSKCSYLDLKGYLETRDADPQGNCMLQRTANRKQPVPEHRQLGAKMSLDEQCFRVTKGQFCPEEQLKHPIDKICVGLYCSKGDNPNDCKARIAYPGTPCGHKKVCKYEHCVDSPNGIDFDVNATCPFGDTGLLGPNKQHCADILTSHPGYCYTHEKTCCKSCHKVPKYHSSGNCRYGDHPIEVSIHNQKYYHCDEAIAVESGICYTHDNECCKSCAALIDVTNPQCRYGDIILKRDITVEGGAKFSSCKDAVGNFSGVCYRNAGECCRSCAGVRDAGNKQCEYGDSPGVVIHNEKTGYKDTCKNVLTNETSGLCYTVERTCCRTCAGLKRNNIPGCAYGDRLGDRLVRMDRRDYPCSVIKETTKGLCHDYSKACCETCSRLKSGDASCQYGDYTEVFYIGRRHTTCKNGITNTTRSECYTRATEQKCCLSCSLLASKDASCKYGDKDPDRCNRDVTSASKCYQTYLLDRCCATCGALKRSNANCQFGDKRPTRSILVGGRTYYTCKAAIAQSAGVCYDNDGTCCKSCPPLKNASRANCEYGDKVMKWGHREGSELFMDCASAAAKHPGICYQSNIEQICCETCEKLKNASKVGCEYGNYPGTIYVYVGNSAYRRTCAEAVTSTTAMTLCQDRNIKTKCCGSCAKFGA